MGLLVGNHRRLCLLSHPAVDRTRIEARRSQQLLRFLHDRIRLGRRLSGSLLRSARYAGVDALLEKQGLFLAAAHEARQFLAFRRVIVGGKMSGCFLDLPFAPQLSPGPIHGADA